MKDITTLIDKYGADIVKQLNIAAGELYTKVIWYVRIEGVIDLLAGIVVLSTALTGAIFAWRIASRDDSLENEILTRCFISSIGGVSFALLGLVILLLIGMPMVKIFVPEYWIIHSIITK